MLSFFSGSQFFFSFSFLTYSVFSEFVVIFNLLVDSILLRNFFFHTSQVI